MAGEHEPPVPEFHDYLVFDGTAFIDTDITVPENCSFVMNMGDEASRRQMRVIRVNPGGADGAIYSHISSFRTDVRSMSYAYDSSSSLKTHNTPTGSRIAWFMTPKRGGYGSQSLTYTKGDAHPLGGISLGGYTGDTSTSYYPYNGTIKYLRVYGSDAQNETSASAISNNHTPIITLIPCLYGSRAGLWHVEGGKFYGNTAGAGTLSVADDE